MSTGDYIKMKNMLSNEVHNLKHNILNGMKDEQRVVHKSTQKRKKEKEDESK